MIEVKLIAETKLIKELVNKDELLALASHAAQKCYQEESPEMGDMINVENRLFGTSHHTTLEYHSFIFDIEGIAVADITFGAHLTSPFYNSDQRSGRFCAKMFLNPDFISIEEYIKILWPELTKAKLNLVMRFVKNGVKIYHHHIDVVTKLAAEMIPRERPNAPIKYIQANAPKIAQEQLRMFISTIFPTGFDHMLDLISLVSLYKAAWTPGQMYLTQKMADLVLARHPEIGYMFSRRKKAWVPEILQGNKIKFKPGFTLTASSGIDDDYIVIPESADMHPVDLLHFCQSIWIIISMT